jgi:hypothetical protein
MVRGGGGRGVRAGGCNWDGEGLCVVGKDFPILFLLLLLRVGGEG